MENLIDTDPEFKASLQKLMELREAGNAKAQFHLGSVFETGILIPGAYLEDAELDNVDAVY